MLCCLSGLLILGGTLVWSGAFMKSIYGQKHSRVEAVEWIYDNIPSLFQLADMDGETVNTAISVPAGDSEILSQDTTVQRNFRP